MDSCSNDITIATIAVHCRRRSSLRRVRLFPSSASSHPWTRALAASRASLNNKVSTVVRYIILFFFPPVIFFLPVFHVLCVRSCACTERGRLTPRTPGRCSFRDCSFTLFVARGAPRRKTLFRHRPPHAGFSSPIRRPGIHRTSVDRPCRRHPTWSTVPISRSTPTV